MTIAAAMDLGSNTLRLLVAKVENGKWHALGRGISTPRLGKGLNEKSFLDKNARAVAFEAAGKFSVQARALGAECIFLGATQACRRAKDGEEFVNFLSDELNLTKAEILSGQKEAELSKKGVLSRLKDSSKGTWLCDLGGGSTELVNLDLKTPKAISVKTGAVSLTEWWNPKEPIAPSELIALDQKVEKTLAFFTDELKRQGCKRLVATAGTACNVASLILELEEYQPEKVNNLVIKLALLDQQFFRLAGLTLAQRKGLAGMERKRADIIIAGIAILRGLTKGLSLTEITAMDAGLLEGVLLDGLGL